MDSPIQIGDTVDASVTLERIDGAIRKHFPSRAAETQFVVEGVRISRDEAQRWVDEGMQAGFTKVRYVIFSPSIDGPVVELAAIEPLTDADDDEST